MNERVTTLAEVLARDGYFTGAFSEGGYAKPQFGLKQGFDVFPLNEGDTPHEHWSNIQHLNRLPQTVDRALKFLGETGDEPFFLFFHTYQVHGPYRPPPELVARYRPGYDEEAEHARIDAALKALREHRDIGADDLRLILGHSEHCGSGKGEDQPAVKAAMDKHGIASLDEQRMQFWRDLYDAGIRNADAELKRLLDALDAPRIRDDTLVVFVSDHGEGFGEHGIVGHGNVLHEEDLRVLFMLRAPGLAPRRVKEMVRTVDVMPTALDLLGVPRDGLQMQGQSLAPLLRGAPWSPAPSFSHALSTRDHEQRLWSVRDGKWRYVWDNEKQLGQLFDLEADPRELTDVAAQNPRVAESLHGKLNAQRDEDALFRERASGPVGDYVLDERDRAELRKLGYFGDDEPSAQHEETSTAPPDKQ
jgi:arylsulfatase A-like enzyme